MSEARRQFTVEFKRESVQLIEQQGLSVSEAARRLDVGTNLLRKWRKRFGEATGQAEETNTATTARAVRQVTVPAGFRHCLWAL
ncbi:MAG: transposase [Planctomycetaceae bacterium]